MSPMKSVHALALSLFALGGFTSCASGRPLLGHGSGVVWSSALVPCTPQLCGGLAVNTATFRLKQGDVSISKNGTVTIRLKGLSDGTTGAPLRGRTLEVWEGAFTTRGFEGGPVNPVGTITTNQAGDYDGAVHMTSRRPLALTPDSAYSTQFALNDPSVRTQFVTGFVVP